MGERGWLAFALVASLTACALGSSAERVVSLAPALTRMVVDVGAGDRLVGVAEHDAAAPEGVVVVGSMMAIDRERLIAVRPDLMVHMGVMGATGGHLEMVARRTGCSVVGLGYPEGVGDVLRLVARYPDEAERVTVGSLVDREAAAVALRRSLEGRLAAVAERVAGVDRPRVLLVFGVEPVAASGPGTVLDEMLALAGGRNALGEAGGPYQVLDQELLRKVSPEAVLLLLPNAPELVAGDARLVPWERSGTPAWREGRVWLLNHPEVLLPSTRMVEVVELMARRLHPALFEAGASDE
ncbi:ABC transporter substrate-binding protein [Mucisphaera calidilacus]|uniref:Vitamin B12-binding protein n=1 Tax=Mucisphaera calidilacus TaxID=2527982 RepID=A0A518BXT2_9BACT|nr:ABC transporter substrate-binding protein [Mucisphaera calidilacus]QDU71789.1 Vitamin B12-binding protein precursor [Mucisphaera calidilacus]